MEGFDLFTKDTSRLKTLYWKVLNYLFLSPFIAKLRYEGDRFGYEDRFFPMYMLIYGDSDAWKTGFINLTRQLMFNENWTPWRKTFSSKPMTSLKSDVKGCPVLIDELTPTYWKYAKDIVKMDVNLIRERLINHPTFVLLSNDINNVSPELSKRIIVINLDNRLDRTSAAYNGKKINTIRKNIDNALYCEYLRRMFEAVDTLIEGIQNMMTKIRMSGFQISSKYPQRYWWILCRPSVQQFQPNFIPLPGFTTWVILLLEKKLPESSKMNINIIAESSAPIQQKWAWNWLFMLWW